MTKRHWLCWLLLAAGCEPYPTGEFNAGAVDPVNFPPPYLGTGGDRTRPGRGTFTEIRAYANGNAIGYYTFPLSTTQAALPARDFIPCQSDNDCPSGGFSCNLQNTPTRCERSCLSDSDCPSGLFCDSQTTLCQLDPRLRLVSGGNSVSQQPSPIAYRFDATTPCRPPPNYVYDPRLDDVRMDMQGNIVTTLPTANYPQGGTPTWSYVPIVAERVVSGTLDCQSVKSATTLLQRSDLTVGTPTGNYLAWALIDVAAGVYRIGETPGTSPGILTQRFGWFDRYIMAYIDGGSIPTTTPDNGRTVLMRPQRLFYPRSNIGTAAGGIGRGYDVLEAGRNDGGYSPVCAVMTYNANQGASPCTQASCLPRDAATILSRYGGTGANAIQPANPPYIYCLQVQ
jgi:hypothetical protein